MSVRNITVRELIRRNNAARAVSKQLDELLLLIKKEK
jgi:hypothetical protein